MNCSTKRDHTFLFILKNLLSFPLLSKLCKWDLKFGLIVKSEPVSHTELFKCESCVDSKSKIIINECTHENEEENTRASIIIIKRLIKVFGWIVFTLFLKHHKTSCETYRWRLFIKNAAYSTVGHRHTIRSCNKLVVF